MEIIKLGSFALTSLFIIILFKCRGRSDISIPISIISGCLIILFVADKVTIIINFLKDMAAKANIDFIYLNTVFKILGIAFVTTFCSEICKDANEKSLASKVEFSGKILILVLSIPILMGVLDAILKII